MSAAARRASSSTCRLPVTAPVARAIAAASDSNDPRAASANSLQGGATDGSHSPQCACPLQLSRTALTWSATTVPALLPATDTDWLVAPAHSVQVPSFTHGPACWVWSLVTVAVAPPE
jgi:hypothetical protein